METAYLQLLPYSEYTITKALPVPGAKFVAVQDGKKTSATSVTVRTDNDGAIKPPIELPDPGTYFLEASGSFTQLHVA